MAEKIYSKKIASIWWTCFYMGRCIYKYEAEIIRKKLLEHVNKMKSTRKFRLCTCLNKIYTKYIILQ